MMKFIAFCFLSSLLVLASCINGGKSTGTNNTVSSVMPAEWKMGIALYSFHRHPFSRALAMSDSARVNYIEGFSFYKLGSDFSDSTLGTIDNVGIVKMKKILEERNISMVSMYVDGAKNVAEWKRFFDIGAALSMKYLVCEPRKEHWGIIDSLAGVYNMKVAIHEHAKGLSAYWHPDSVLAAIKDHKNIGACADLGHWARSGLDVVECLKKLDGHIVGLHLKDVAELNNPRAADVHLGTGVIDFPAVVKELRRQKFNGYVQVECEHNLDNNLEEVKDAIKYFNDLSTKLSPIR